MIGLPAETRVWLASGATDNRGPRRRSVGWKEDGL